jgi:hypothetical protein
MTSQAHEASLNFQIRISKSHTCNRVLAAPLRPSFVKTASLNIEGAGKAGCPLHPQPGVRKMKAHQHSHHRFNRISPAFPARVVLTVSFVLSPVSMTF